MQQIILVGRVLLVGSAGYCRTIYPAGERFWCICGVNGTAQVKSQGAVACSRFQNLQFACLCSSGVCSIRRCVNVKQAHNEVCISWVYLEADV